MKFTNLQHKTVSMIVLATFVTLLYFSATPVPAATSAGDSKTTIAQNDNDGPSFFEETTSSEPVIKKEKKFPILFVALGAVAVGVAVYFLLIKKQKYTLNVTMDANSTGTPATTAMYKKDTVVRYSYNGKNSYSVDVTLDGVAVPDSGTVTMDKDHTLKVVSHTTVIYTVLCTAMYNQGFLPEDIYKVDGEYGSLQDYRVMTGYRFLAAPLAKQIGSNRLLAHIFKYPVRAWAYHMAYRMKAREQENWLGWTIEAIGKPICFAVGSILTYNEIGASRKSGGQFISPRAYR